MPSLDSRLRRRPRWDFVTGYLLFMRVVCKVGGVTHSVIFITGTLVGSPGGLGRSGLFEHLVGADDCRTESCGHHSLCVFNCCPSLQRACYSIVPYVDGPNTGSVAGIVSAGGNVGAVPLAQVFIKSDYPSAMEYKAGGRF